MATDPPPQAPIGVLFVSTDLRVGGQERKLVEIVRSLDPARFRPVVACLKEPGALAPEVEAAGVPLHARLIRARWDAWVLVRLIRIIRRERIRVVCTVGCGDKMFWGRLAGWLGGARGLVATIHKTRGADGRRVIELPNRWLTGITDAFVAVARSAAEYLVEEEGLPRAKVTVIYNGVDLERFRGAGRAAARAALGLPPHALVVAHVAAFRPEKGHDVLLRAAARVVAGEPRAVFLLVGDGPTRAQVERAAHAAGLGAQVRFLGQRRDVPEILAASDLLTLTSRDRVETFPNCVLEGMASALPAVCTDVGSLREMVEDGQTGFLVPEGDDAALAERMLRLLGNETLRLEFGARARSQTAARFSSRRMVEAREALFERLARG